MSCSGGTKKRSNPRNRNIPSIFTGNGHKLQHRFAFSHHFFTFQIQLPSSSKANYTVTNCSESILSCYLVTIGSAAWLGPHLPSKPLPLRPVLPTGLRGNNSSLLNEYSPIKLCLSTFLRASSLFHGITFLLPELKNFHFNLFFHFSWLLFWGVNDWQLRVHEIGVSPGGSLQHNGMSVGGRVILEPLFAPGDQGSRHLHASHFVVIGSESLHVFHPGAGQLVQIWNGRRWRRFSTVRPHWYQGTASSFYNRTRR